MNTVFKVSAEGLTFELAGSEEFVRKEMGFVLPLLGPIAGKEREPEDPDGLESWYERTVPPSRSPTMQDHILIFAYHMNRVKRQFIFAPDDIKYAFQELNQTVPKSLLQIMGSLKRDHQLLWSPEGKRGEYALQPAGIKHVERLLGIRRPESRPAVEQDAVAAVTVQDGGNEEEPKGRWQSLFREQQTE